MFFVSVSTRRFAANTTVWLAVCLFTACGGSSSMQSPPPPVAPSITAQPSSKTVVVGQPAAFTVGASGTAPLSYQWRKGGTDISGATSVSYTTPATVLGDSGSTFDVVVSNSVGNATSSAATLGVNPVPVDVVTYHYDNARTGANLNEAILTPGNVSSTTFGKIGFYTVDGKVDAQPLYLSQVSIAGGTHNVLYVVTEGDTAYAFDADSGTILWQKSMLVGSETTSDRVSGCTQVDPQIGVTSTPVIDRTRGTIYLVAMSRNGSSYIQRIHALDLATGAERSGSPALIQATYPGTGDNSSGGNVVFDPKQYEERSALLLLNGVVYTTWTSHCDIRPYTGWVIGYDASTLLQTKVMNVTPNGNEGAIWMAGAGPAADANNIYFLNGNGTFDTALDGNGFPSQGDYGNSFIKLSTSGTLAVADYFTMHNTVAESNADLDLGSGGVIVLPDLTDSSSQVQHLAIGAGKDKILYLVDRDNMGKFHSTGDQIYQELSNVLANGVFSKPAYFNSTVYYDAFGDSIKAFAIVAAKLKAVPASKTSNAFTYPGASPSISANGTSDAILWAVENTDPAVLHAYDAAHLDHKLYDSTQAASSRDQFGPGNKFITPMIVNGKVFVGTQTGVAVFGLLP